jgi:hypothetical protein
LVLAFGSQLVVGGLAILGGAVLPEPAVAAMGVLVDVLMLGSAGALAYFGYRTAQEMGSGAAWVWAAGMFAPCLNVIVLLVVSGRATSFCRDAGIPVGILGPKVPGEEPAVDSSEAA